MTDATQTKFDDSVNFELAYKLCDVDWTYVSGDKVSAIYEILRKNGILQEYPTDYESHLFRQYIRGVLSGKSWATMNHGSANRGFLKPEFTFPILEDILEILER